MPNTPLSPEEFAALVAIDGTLNEHRPSAQLEIRLRHLGFIERCNRNGMPIRTPKGAGRVKSGQ